MDDFADNEAFGGDVDADNIEESAKSTTFKAWHRPRKHWVRSKQWWSAINDLRNEAAHKSAESFNLLTLPGGELLDVRYFHSRLQGVDDDSSVRRLRLVGFVNNPEEFEKAQRNLPLLGISDCESKEALIKRDDIDNLVHNNGVALKAVKDRGPFEIVNLDYCNSLAPPGNSSRVESIFQLLRYQIGYQTKPWLFMITTRTAKGAVCEDFFEKLMRVVEDNVSSYPEFLEEFFDNYPDAVGGIDGVGYNPYLKSVEDIGECYSDFFVLGFLKWVTQYAVKHQTKVKLKSVVRYDVERDDSNYDMFSLVLRLEKVGLIGDDPANVVQLPAHDGGIEPEWVFASRFIRKVRETKVVEEIIFGDEGRYKAISNDLADLLARCDKCIDTFWDQVCRPEIEVQGWDLDEIKA